MRDNLVSIHCAGNELADLIESDLAGTESVDGDFVGGVHDCRERAAEFARATRELEGGKAIRIRFFERETADAREVGLDTVAADPLGIRERVLDRQAHVRR